MALATGAKLGPYEVAAKIGAGGMGEVYCARDTRLQRDVAIKVLPATLSPDAEHLRRFEQEARAVSALNHPNILAIYDVGTHNGGPFLVMELLEGETLRERMQQGAIPVRKALEIASQVARGVAAAHEKGIVHRDLKPANIFLTSDGRVKVLDFGLAKLTQRGDDSALGETQLSTRTNEPLSHASDPSHTQPGVVLGTFGYMSPEQVRGQPSDARSDIFSLGTILYEMLSGHRAFQRDSSADTMAAILKDDPPDLSGEDKKIPPAVDRVVRHCIEKNPAERFQSARDLAFALDSLSGSSAARAAERGAAATTAQPDAEAEAASKATSAKLMKRRLFLASTGVIALVLACLAGYIVGHTLNAPREFTYQQLTFERGLIYGARFASDGQTVYYAAAWNGQPVQIYSMTPGSPESRQLGLTNSSLVAVTPSQMAVSLGCLDLAIGHCKGTMALVPLSGGAPRQIADDVVAADGARDSDEMAVVRDLGGKFQVEWPIGKVLYQTNHWLDSVRISPRGDKIAFVDYPTTSGDLGSVNIIDRNGKQVARTPEMYISVEGVAWVPDGNEVWFAASLNQGWADTIFSMNLAGKERVILNLPGTLRLHDISREGRVLLSKEIWRTEMRFRGPKDSSERGLSWLDSSSASDLSPDAENLAFGGFGEAQGTQPVAYMRKTDGSPAVRLGIGYMPVFSPDQSWVLSLIYDPSRLVLLPTGAGNPRELPASGIKTYSSQGWMPGGKEIYFAGDNGTDWRMYLQDWNGGTVRAVTPPIFIDPQRFRGDLVSPDGKFIFARDVNGKPWFYSLAGGEPRAIPGMETRDNWAGWSSDGRSIYVYQDQHTHAPLYRIEIAAGSRQQVATLAPGDPAGVTSIYCVRLTPDGKAYAYSYSQTMSNLFVAYTSK
jgi:eukaryotic-like serine/threonine-protein kinase